MPQWLNSRIRGALMESSLYPTDDAAIAALRNALTRHEQRGSRYEQKWNKAQSSGAYWEIFDSDGESVAVYWLSEGNEGASRGG